MADQDQSELRRVFSEDIDELTVKEVTERLKLAIQRDARKEVIAVLEAAIAYLRNRDMECSK